jgi:hypothetical protein
VQARRIELDEERAQLAHRTSRRRRGGPQEPPRLVVGRPLGRAGEAERRPGEMLHRPVVEIRGDAAPVLVRGVERPQQQPLPVALGGPEPPRKRHRERHLGEPQQHEAEHKRRCEREPDPMSGGGDRAEAEVGLEEERAALVRRHRRVHLEQLLLLTLEPILRPREVADLGGRCAGGRECRALVGIEPVPVADQPPLVRVDDPAVGRPHLHADDRRPHDVGRHDPVQLPDRGRIAPHDRVQEMRLDHGVRDQLRHPARILHGLALAGAAEGEDRRERDEQHCDQPRGRELQQEPPEGGRAHHPRIGKTASDRLCRSRRIPDPKQCGLRRDRSACHRVRVASKAGPTQQPLVLGPAPNMVDKP